MKSTDEESKIPSFPARKWNTDDFVGKYHLSRIENKETPVPGTQINIEKDFTSSRQNFYETFDKNQIELQDKLKSKLEITKKGAEFRTRVYFDAFVYNTIEQGEDVVDQKEVIKNDAHLVKDDLKSIKAFQTNIAHGRHHYVGTAIAANFKSIDYADPLTGNTALHVAVKKGYKLVVEELMKYKADPEVINKLGYRAIHNAWSFWMKKKDGLTGHNRTKEERLAQEQLTYDILLSLLSYGAFVDATDIKGNTPLHIACRLGPTSVVKLLLSFKANCWFANRKGETAMDIAEQFEHEESCRLIRSWKNIGRTMVNIDFSVVWNTFLRDYESVISDKKTAETILSEMMMEKNLHLLEREGKGNVIMIEDALLENAFYEHRDEQNNISKAPKPWEEGWEDFKIGHREKHLEDMKARLAVLQAAQAASESNEENIKSKKKKKNIEKELEIKKLPDNPDPIPGLSNTSAIAMRRKNLAKSVSLDAKFINFTRRLATSSALLIPLRAPECPMTKTEEEHSIIRHIASQGKEYDKFKKYQKVDKLEALYGIRKPHSLNALGSYNKAVELTAPNSRDLLYDQVITVHKSEVDEDGPVQMKEIVNKYDPPKKDKIDLVQGIRPRYVNPDLLPPKRIVTLMEQMSIDKKEREEVAYRERHGISSSDSLDNARKMLEESILNNASGDDNNNNNNNNNSDELDQSLSLHHANHKKKKLEEKQLALTNMFLVKPEVKYGVNRITSTHNTKGKIEEPWSTVKGRYSTLPGDRTA